MSDNNFIYKAKRIIKQQIITPIIADYLPPEYECRWGATKHAKLSALFSPIRKLRDKKKFDRHLRANDLFIVGHPKSGNTWVAYMTAILAFKDMDNQINLSNIGTYAPVIHAKDSDIRKYNHTGGTRVFRNEWPVYPKKYPKVIYLVRDPRAILVSYYHMFVTYFDKQDISMNAFIKEYLSKGYIQSWEPLMRWDRQVLYWLKRAQTDRRILLVKYEDTVADRRATLARIADFAEIEYTEALLDFVEERGSFSSMRANEDRHGAESYPDEIGQRGKFIRKGKIDSWRDEMPSKTVMRVERELAPAMKKMGYL